EVHVSENFLSNESVKLLLASLKLGLEDVEKMYGDFIKIENN
ncbi:ribosomal-processing cysteine protease Prp, partial [Lactobacillus salivarius]|nr:ribosomal-processing cysteine protease Prp [Ligilactobacillus salivarius]